MIALFAVGVVTGTVLSFELGLLWPAFIAIYVYGWDRLSPRMHLLSGIPVVIAGFAGSLFVISVNGWMNHPGGFALRDGSVVDVHPFSALFANSFFWHELIHMYLGGFMVTGFLIAAAYAWGWLRGRRGRYHRTALVIPLTLAALAAPVQVVVGDWAARTVAKQQPIKLAAIEGLPTTTKGAPEHLLGWYDGSRVEYGIKIPRLLSLLAFHQPNATVTGLDAVPPQNHPSQSLINVVRFAFQGMVGIGTLLALLGVVFLAVWVRKRRLPHSVWFYRGLVLAGPLSLVALICGWVTTEVGRQPWIAYGVMRTSDLSRAPVGSPSATPRSRSSTWRSSRRSSGSCAAGPSAGARTRRRSPRSSRHCRSRSCRRGGHHPARFGVRPAGGWTHRERGLIDDLFALSSILTPFALGAAVGGIASGRVPVGNAAGNLVTSWLNPTSIMIGAIAVAAAAHLAAVYLAADATRAGAAELVRGFRVRALLSGFVTGVLALAGLAVVHGDAEHLFEGLTHGAGLAAVLVSGAAGVATLVLVWAGRFEPARYAGALSVAAVVAGWALAQRPDLLPGLTVGEAAAGRATLITVLVVVGIGAVVLIPSLALLFGLFLHGRFDLSTAPETAVERHESSPPTPTLGVILLGLLVVGAVLAVFGASWGLALGIALLLVFVLGGFVVLASATATGENDDLRPAFTGHGGPGDDDAQSAAVVNLAGDGTTAADPVAGSRRIQVGYTIVALAAAAVWILRRLIRAARVRRRHAPR